MKVLHLLSTNSYSGAEKMATEIILQTMNNYENYYASPPGSIEQILDDKNIKFIPIRNFSLIGLINIKLKLKPDIIHAHDYKASSLAALSNLLIKSRTISHIHHNSPNMKAVNLKTLSFLALSKKIEKIVVVSKEIKNDLVIGNVLKNKIEIIENVMNSSEIYTNRDKIYDLIFVGRLELVKNPLRFIEIVNHLSKSNPDIKAVILGDGSLYIDIIKQIKRYNLQNNIEVLGFKINPEEYITQAKLLVVTSEFEGFGLAVVEAMKNGVPTISTDVGGLKTLIKNNYNGYRVNINQEFIDKIQETLYDRSLYDELSRNSFEESKHYTNIKEFKKKWEIIYKGNN